MLGGLFGRGGSAHRVLSPMEAFERAGRGEITLVDVREAGEWAQRRIKGAKHAPLSGFPAALDALPEDKPIVFYCLSGARSGRAIDICKRLGMPCDMHMAGGIAAWMASGLPVEG